jgi:hypothetical protein
MTAKLSSLLLIMVALAAPASADPLYGHAEQADTQQPSLQRSDVWQGTYLNGEVGDWDNIPRAEKENQLQSAVAKNAADSDIAWEAWWHRFSAAVHDNMCAAKPQIAGAAIVKYTITNDRHIQVHIVQRNEPSFNPLTKYFEHKHGSPMIRVYLLGTLPEYEAQVMTAYQALDGSPILEFPPGSQRQSVKGGQLEVRGEFLHSGYEWKKDDVEHVHSEW